MELEPLSPSQFQGYLKRISYPGCDGCPDIPEPTLATLRALHTAHVQAIPYENFTLRHPWLQALHGSKVQLDTATLYDKIVNKHRGGYCFENNGIMAAALKACGFKMRMGAARVIREFDETVHGNAVAGNEDEVALRGHGHMVIFVEVEDGSTWLEDVGYGGRCPTEPLAFHPYHQPPPPESLLQREQLERCTTHRLRRGVAGSTIIPPDNMKETDPYRYGWYMQAETSQGFRDQYFFLENEWPLVDYQTMNWYQQTHPDSFFVNNTIAAIQTPEGRITLNDRLLKKFTPDGVAESELEEGAELDAALTKYFGMRFD
ncbi:hypothetical protein WJX72_005134 [[Myrmecia] bisecta]|uniref:Arylamine N-acetyltransferase n=1 Tax=[Myrmecia] bisecta TaxID=41462 RepID=A0AAW1PHS0_9CHLO